MTDESSPDRVDALRRAMRAAEKDAPDATTTQETWTRACVDYYLALYPGDAVWRRAGSEGTIPSVDEIRQRAEVAHRASRAIPRMGRLDPRPGRHDEWSARVGWGRETLAAVFTDGFEDSLEGLRAGDTSGLEYGLRFLEADPWCQASGYAKEHLIGALLGIELDDPTRERLRRVILGVVDDRRPRREIRRFGALAAVVGSPGLRSEVELRLASPDRQVRYNARRVLAAIDARRSDS